MPGLRPFLVVIGALAGIFGFFFALYVLGAYAIAQVPRYFLLKPASLFRVIMRVTNTPAGR
jgi:hypothetical protein